MDQQHGTGNTRADDALNAGVAENLVATAPGIDLPEADFAVPIYQHKDAAPPITMF